MPYNSDRMHLCRWHMDMWQHYTYSVYRGYMLLTGGQLSKLPSFLRYINLDKCDRKKAARQICPVDRGHTGVALELARQHTQLIVCFTNVLSGVGFVNNFYWLIVLSSEVFLKSNQWPILGSMLQRFFLLWIVLFDRLSLNLFHGI